MDWKRYRNEACLSTRARLLSIDAEAREGKQHAGTPPESSRTPFAFERPLPKARRVNLRASADAIPLGDGSGPRTRFAAAQERETKDEEIALSLTHGY